MNSSLSNDPAPPPPLRSSNLPMPIPPLQPELSPPPIGSFREPRESLLPYTVIDQVSALPPVLRQGSGHLTGIIAQHLPPKENYINYMRKNRIGLSHPGLKSELQKRYSSQGHDRSEKYRIMSSKAINSPAWKEELPLDERPVPIPTREAGWLSMPGKTPGDRPSRWGGKKRQTRRRKTKKQKKQKKQKKSKKYHS